MWHAVPAQDFFEDDKAMYIVMEYCSGGDLYAMFKAAAATESKRQHAPLPMNMVRGVMFQVAQALAYLHGSSIMHRDLKMSNILLQPADATPEGADEDGIHPAVHGCAWSAKLGDFGLSVRIASHLEEHFTVCGTPHYISPEMAAKRPHTLSADWWSFGCLLYALLFDASPVRRSSNSTASRSKHAPPVSEEAFASTFHDNLQRLSPAWRSCLRSLLTLDPQLRPTAQQVLQAPCWEEPIQITPASTAAKSSSSTNNARDARASRASSVSTQQRSGHGSSVAGDDSRKASAPPPQPKKQGRGATQGNRRERHSGVKRSSGAAKQRAVVDRLARGAPSASALAAAASHRRRTQQAKAGIQRQRALVERPSPLVASPGRLRQPPKAAASRAKQKRSPHRAPASTAPERTSVQTSHALRNAGTAKDPRDVSASAAGAEGVSGISSAEGVSLMHVPTPVPMPGSSSAPQKQSTPSFASAATDGSSAAVAAPAPAEPPSPRPEHRRQGGGIVASGSPGQWRQRHPQHRPAHDIWGGDSTDSDTKPVLGAATQELAASVQAGARGQAQPVEQTAQPAEGERFARPRKAVTKQRVVHEQPPSFDEIVIPKTVEPSFLGGLSSVYEAASGISTHESAAFHTAAPDTGTSTHVADAEPESTVTQSTAAGATPMPRTSRLPPPSSPPRPPLHSHQEHKESEVASSAAAQSVYTEAAEALQQAQRWLQAIPPKAAPQNQGLSNKDASTETPPPMEVTQQTTQSSSDVLRSGPRGSELEQVAAAERRQRRQQLLARARRQQLMDEAQTGTQAAWIRQSYGAAPAGLSLDQSQGDTLAGSKPAEPPLQPAPVSQAGHSFVAGVALGSSFLSGATSQNSSRLTVQGPRVVSVPASKPAALSATQHATGALFTEQPAATPQRPQEAPLPPIELQPLQKPFDYSSAKALVHISPQHGWVWGVFHSPRRWFDKVLRRQEATIRRLQLEQQCSTRLEGERIQAKLDTVLRTRHGVLSLLQATHCIHLRLHTARGDTSCFAELALSSDPSPQSLSPQHEFPAECERYPLQRLPKWSHKLHKYLAKLVQAVKARTPLLVLVGSSGRTAMMANLPRPLVACKLPGGWRVQYDLALQRMTLQRETPDSSTKAATVLSLARGDCEGVLRAAAAGASGRESQPELVVLRAAGDSSPAARWARLSERESDALLPVVQHTQQELFSVLRLWERVLSTRDALETKAAGEGGQLSQGDSALLKSLTQLPVVLKQPTAAAPPAVPHTAAAQPQLLKARRRRQGGVKAVFADGGVLRVAADGQSVRFQHGSEGNSFAARDNAGGSSVLGVGEGGVDSSFATASSAGSAGSGGKWLPIDQLPSDAGKYLECLRGYLRHRKARIVQR